MLTGPHKASSTAFALVPTCEGTPLDVGDEVRERPSSLPSSLDGTDVPCCDRLFEGVSMSTQYDPSIIYNFADRLYARARVMAAQYGVFGGIFGLICGVAFAASIRADAGPFAVVGAVLLGGLAALVGHDKSFALRLTAQQALCQVKIEEGIRHVAGQTVTHHDASRMAFAPAAAPPYAAVR
jgi:hypothetical protein